MILVPVFGNVQVMQRCGQRAILVVTRVVQGTSTSIARRRIELTCSLVVGHDGEHRDPVEDETWEAKPGQTPTLLRHEDDDE
ncbi:MAG TPA: hypothetical protein VHC69_34375 [Polyangiaceae bacterium]|nr:hypothetical protein [Polyangiaceae bacterium]